MRRRALAMSVLLSVAGCSTEPDYVAMTRGPDCSTRAKLFRRGFPENLEALLIDECTVTYMEPVRGEDLADWLNASASWVITSCDSPVPFSPVLFWTERSPEGKITKFHFCPEFCLGLKNRLLAEVKLDSVCPPEGAAGAAATVPAGSGTVVPLFDAGTWFVRPAAGSGGNPGGGAGASGGGAGGGANGAAGVAGASAGAGSGAVSGAGGSAGTSGASGAAGTS